MKHKSSLMWLAVVLGFIFLPTIDNDNTTLGKTVEKWNSEINTIFTDINARFSSTGVINQNSVSSSKDSSSDETPIETNVQGKTLSNTYYYHYDKNVSQAVKYQFNQAVKIYNRTGIVKLVKGDGTAEQIRLNFRSIKRQWKLQLFKIQSSLVMVAGHYSANWMGCLYCQPCNCKFEY